jgi:hypothetical protein
MEKIKNAVQESSAQSNITIYKIVAKESNNAEDFGEVCPYCGNKDTAMLNDAFDEKTNVITEAWVCYSPGCIGFCREVKLDENGKIVWSKTFACVV